MAIWTANFGILRFLQGNEKNISAKRKTKDFKTCGYF